MPKKTTPRYGINYGWSLGEGPWNTDMDSNLKALDTLIGTTIISDALATPPASPAAGDSYIVAASATGAWAGKSGQVATYIDSAWKFIVPKRGLRAEVQSASGFKYYNGTAWTAEPSGGGGATALSGLTDVNVTEGGAIDQYSLVWDNATSKWIAKDVSGTGGATALSDLTDVDVTTTAPSNGQVLTWNDTASKWQNQDPTGGGGGIPDAPTDGNIYGRQNASWVEVPSGGATALSGLTDVNVTEGGAIDQYSLVWDDATSKWIAKDVSGTGGATALSGLSDVDVTEGSAIADKALTYDSGTGKWVAKDTALNPASGSSAVWDGAHTSSDYTASNGGQTITTTAASQATALSDLDLMSGGTKRYFEILVGGTASPNFYCAIGVAPQSASLSQTIGYNLSHSAALTATGLLEGTGTYNGTANTNNLNNWSTMGTWTHGDTIGIAFDPATRTIWIRKNGGSWLDDATADPATGARGFIIDGTADLYPAVTSGVTPLSFTVKTGDFAYAPPTGFAPATTTVGVTDVVITTPADGDVLTYDDATGKWVNAAASSGVTALSGLSDVNVVGPTNGQILEYNSASGKWENGSAIGTTAPIALVSYLPGVPAASAVVMKAIVPLAVTFPIGLSGSYAKCDVAATASVTCPITQNGTNVGSVNFAAGATTGTFTFSAAITTTPGDVIAVAAPSSPDSTFAGLSVALAASAPAVSSNTTVASMSDVSIASPADGQMLVYSAAAGKWQNANMPDENGIIDGNFDSWQIATSFALAAATDTYTADMWIGNAGTGGAATVSRDTPALGSEPAIAARPRKYRLKFQQTTAASTSPTIGQKLESVLQYQGQSITVSGLFAAAAAATDIVGVKATQHFGSGGSPSADVVTTKTVTWALGTAEARFSVRLDIPSISGKTLGTNGDDYLRIDVLLATGSTYTVYQSQLQIDLCESTASGDTTGSGGAPLPFRWRGPGVEQARVARYIQVDVTNTNAGFETGVASSSTVFNCYKQMPHGAMRISPTTTILKGNLTAGGSTGATTVNAVGTGLFAAHITNGTAIFTTGYGYACLDDSSSGSGTAILLDARL